MKLNPIYIDLIEENIDGAYKFPFYLFCHRIPERSFKLKNHYFPLCARCTGIWISGIASIIFLTFSSIALNITTLFLAGLLLIPMIVDGVSQLVSIRTSNNKLRFFTGLLAGVGLIILAKAMKFLIIT